MQWLVTMFGLAVLFAVSRGTRRKTPPSCRDALLEEDLSAHLSAVSSRSFSKARARLKPPPSLSAVMTRGVGYLAKRPQKELLPAAQWLNDNGRFLQECAASLRGDLHRSPKLPADGSGVPRILVLSRELVGHRNAELTAARLTEAVQAWQSHEPLSVEEAAFLPYALQTALLDVLREMILLCVKEQRAYDMAQPFADALLHGRHAKVLRRFEQYRDSTPFVEHLLQLLREEGDTSAIEWLDSRIAESTEIARLEQDHQTENRLWVGNAITSLRVVSRLPWERLTEQLCDVHQALCADETYPKMDAESRAYYRSRVSAIAKHTRQPEAAVCDAALRLASVGKADSVAAHVGYYLLDDGEAQLTEALHGSPWLLRLRSAALPLFRVGEWVGFVLLMLFGWAVVRLPEVLLLPFGALFLQPYRQLCARLAARFLPRRMVPRLQIERLETPMLVVCPTLLTDASQALAMVRHLSILHQANPDPNLHFLLLGDPTEKLTASASTDAEIIRTASSAIEALCEDTGHPFFYLHRERVLQDRRYMSRERKRGGVETLLKLIDGRPIDDSFAYCSCPKSALEGRYRYVITLDSDTILPPNAALQLIGAMQHPLQRRTLFNGHMRGASVLQPRMEIAPHTHQSRLSVLLGGRGGMDSYQSLASELWQDVYGRGTFVGKGIIDPPAFLDAMEGKIPAGLVLSHDLLEGELAGCRYLSDVVLYDSHPAALRAALLRLHRWTRGDWQLLPYLLPIFPAYPHTARLDALARHKLWLNLLRSLIAPCRLLLMLYAVAVGNPWLLLAAALSNALSALLPPRAEALAAEGVELLLLPCVALTQLDAALRALWRLIVSRRQLLQWTTAAQLSKPTLKPSMLYFDWSMGTALFTLALGFLASPWLALAPAVLWAAFPFCVPFLEQAYRRPQPMTGYMREELTRLASETFLFFDTFVTASDGFLPPDNVQIEPNKGVAHRTSPTNIGLYMVSLLAAERLGFLSPEEAANRLAVTLSSVEALPRCFGHLYNWYDTQTLEPLAPLFVSSVDSGNFAVCLLCCAQGLRALLPKLGDDPRDLSARMDALVESMRFDLLYDADAELFRIGLRPNEPPEALSHYDLLASESRLLSFVAIALGQVPVRHWHRLSRAMTAAKHGATLLSYSGTMFEYLMPLLFLPTVKGTLLHRACENALREQRRHRRDGVFGISESGYYAFDPNLHYQYRAFGVPSLALDPTIRQDVIAPYASALALPLDSKAAFLNLRRLTSLGMEGPLGMFEAADFCAERVGSKRRYRIVRSHMAHHQGMILCALCNALCDDYLAKLFADLPRAQAYALLLEERAARPRGMVRHPLKRVEPEQPFAPLMARRAAYPFYFPIDAHLLHGGGTTLLLDAQGNGFLSRNGVMATRFRENCALRSGARFYLRDSHSGAYWFLTDPTAEDSTEFETAQAVFTRERMRVESTLRVFVNPLDGTALHCITLQNRSDTDRLLELCSYLEPALVPQKDDLAHPAFGNLFIRTARLGAYGVSAVRRPRAEGESERRLLHTLASDLPFGAFLVQTDRSVFLGRNQPIEKPASLAMPIGTMANRVGDVVEPCLSLRAQFTLPAGSQARFVFATLLCEDAGAGFAERYASVDAADKAYESAKTQGLVTARFLDLDAATQNAVGRLCGALVYTGQPHQYRTNAVNVLPLRGLWGMGVSGDLPILVATIEEPQGLALIRELLKAHAYYRLCGLWTDLVVVSRQRTGYAHPLRDSLDELFRASHSRELIGKEGGLHLLERESLTAEAYGLLLSAARIVLTAENGSLRDQLRAMLTACRPQTLDQAKPSLLYPEELPPMKRLLDNGFGGFTDTGYQIDLPVGKNTPAPWCNMLAMPRFGTLASESGIVFSYAGNSHEGRLTRWPNDAVSPVGGENFYLRDVENRLLWSVTRAPLGQILLHRATHEAGVTTYEGSAHGIYRRLTVFTDSEQPFGVRTLYLRNDSERTRTLQCLHVCDFTLSNHPSEIQLTSLSRREGVVYAVNPAMEGVAFLAMTDPAPTVTTTMCSGVFHGLFGAPPTALCTTDALPCDAGSVGVLSLTVTLSAGESVQLTDVLGFAADRAQADELLALLRADGAARRQRKVRLFWEKELGGLSFDLPDLPLSLMMNRWLPYQVRAARLFARAGFYQAGGAYGFRDQLQDMLSQLYAAPERVRAHLLLSAAHQFEEGDVQHWWHPPYRGVRTRISDDLLFLPYVAAKYVLVTGDQSVLGEPVAYLHGEPLADGEQERYFEATASDVVEPLHLHCLRAIEHVRFGAHGLPLMMGGDWNDGMNRVGGENGESVWLGMFYCEVIRAYLPLCDAPTAETLSARRERVLRQLDREAWESDHYLRAWFDDGHPLGSSHAEECRIDLLPQSWSVLAGLSRERSAIAMETAVQRLYDSEVGLVKLFEPPFDGKEQPGYIAGYLPGIRENGGQYTHAVPWAIAALHRLGRDELAWEITRAILPIRHSLTPQQAARYRVEPYVMAADVYANPNQRGRGGWTWYTGSASWLYVVVLEELLGLRKVGNAVSLRTSVPADWESFTVTYRFGTATYHLHAQRDCPFATADGERLADGTLTLRDDGRIHEATFPIRPIS